MSKYLGLVAVLILVGVGTFLFINSEDRNNVEPKKSDVTEEKYDRAPEFSLENYERSVVSSAYSEKDITIVNAWATWCPFCVEELHDFALLQEMFRDEIAVVAIDRAESLDKVKKFSDDLNITGRITLLLDPKDSFYQSIGGFGMPETIFVNNNGDILLHKRGPLSFEEMKQHIEEMLLEI
ncbi:MAG: TlpA family protein disulfide reductase [Parcubacteria group bacterium]|nr:TlpA family protein disulfide reductase [Parcubacteria group bacterium]